MADFVFTSPGVKFKERNVGITTLGLAGETLKGPAFEPVFIQDQGQFSTRFGAQSTKRFQNAEKTLQYQLPYVANAFLEEAQQLWVTRVLGLSGYKADTAWNITLDAGVDPETEGIVGTPTTNTGVPFEGNSYLGVALGFSGATGVSDTGYTKNGSIFTNYIHEFTATTKTTTGGTVTDKVTQYSATSLTEYEGMVLAIIRSRGDSNTAVDSVPVTTFQTDSLEITGNTTSGSINPTGDIFSEFNLIAKDTGSTVIGAYKVSLNPYDSSWLPNVIGYEAKDKNTAIWVQAIYPDLIKKLDEDGIAYAINTEMVEATTDVFNDYEVGFQTPETPWVVSQLKGNSVDRLFKFISISDGNSANEEIKISIMNIDPYTGEFDVMIRNFYDTDANPSVLETYTKCTMVKGTSSYIGQRIGTSDGEYSLLSTYVMIEMAEEVPQDVFPAGFEGFMFNNYAMSATGDGSTSGVAPKIFYKTEYEDTDKINKTFLGITEHLKDFIWIQAQAL